MGGYRLTVRRGPSVGRHSFDDLEKALAAMRAQVEAALGEGPLAGVTMLRDFAPGDRVAARVELSTGGWLRGSDAGVDVMGDGRLIAYRGGIRRRELSPDRGESVYDAIRAELAGPRR